MADNHIEVRVWVNDKGIGGYELSDSTEPGLAYAALLVMAETIRKQFNIDPAPACKALRDLKKNRLRIVE